MLMSFTFQDISTGGAILHLEFTEESFQTIKNRMQISRKVKCIICNTLSCEECLNIV